MSGYSRSLNTCLDPNRRLGSLRMAPKSNPMKVADPALTPGHFLKATDLSAAEQLQISAMSVSHREVRLAAQLAQKKALEALRQRLVGAG